MIDMSPSKKFIELLTDSSHLLAILISPPERGVPLYDS